MLFFRIKRKGFFHFNIMLPMSRKKSSTLLYWIHIFYIKHFIIILYFDIFWSTYEYIHLIGIIISIYFLIFYFFSCKLCGIRVKSYFLKAFLNLNLFIC